MGTKNRDWIQKPRIKWWRKEVGGEIHHYLTFTEGTIEHGDLMLEIGAAFNKASEEWQRAWLKDHEEA
jgi:hypothetical protein